MVHAIAACHSGNYVVSGRIWLKFKSIQAVMHFLVSCKKEDVPIKNEGDIVVTKFLLCKSMGFFSDAQGQLTVVHGRI